MSKTESPQYTDLEDIRSHLAKDGFTTDSVRVLRSTSTLALVTFLTTEAAVYGDRQRRLRNRHNRLSLVSRYGVLWVADERFSSPKYGRIFKNQSVVVISEFKKTQQLALFGTDGKCLSEYAVNLQQINETDTSLEFLSTERHEISTQDAAKVRFDYPSELRVFLNGNAMCVESNYYRLNTAPCSSMRLYVIPKNSPTAILEQDEALLVPESFVERAIPPWKKQPSRNYIAIFNALHNKSAKHQVGESIRSPLGKIALWSDGEEFFICDDASNQLSESFARLELICSSAREKTCRWYLASTKKDSRFELYSVESPFPLKLQNFDRDIFPTSYRSTTYPYRSFKLRDGGEGYVVNLNKEESEQDATASRALLCLETVSHIQTFENANQVLEQDAYRSFINDIDEHYHATMYCLNTCESIQKPLYGALIPEYALPECSVFSAQQQSAFAPDISNTPAQAVFDTGTVIDDYQLLSGSIKAIYGADTTVFIKTLRHALRRLQPFADPTTVARLYQYIPSTSPLESLEYISALLHYFYEHELVDANFTKALKNDTTCEMIVQSEVSPSQAVNVLRPTARRSRF